MRWRAGSTKKPAEGSCAILVLWRNENISVLSAIIDGNAARKGYTVPGGQQSKLWLVCPSRQVIQRNVVIIRQPDQVGQRDRLESPLIPAVNGLPDAQQLCDVFLGEVRVFPHVPKSPEIHADLPPSYTCLVTKSTIDIMAWNG